MCHKFFVFPVNIVRPFDWKCLLRVKWTIHRAVPRQSPVKDRTGGVPQKLRINYKTEEQVLSGFRLPAVAALAASNRLKKMNTRWSVPHASFWQSAARYVLVEVVSANTIGSGYVIVLFCFKVSSTRAGKRRPQCVAMWKGGRFPTTVIISKRTGRSMANFRTLRIRRGYVLLILRRPPHPPAVQKQASLRVFTSSTMTSSPSFCHDVQVAVSGVPVSVPDFISLFQQVLHGRIFSFFSQFIM